MLCASVEVLLCAPDRFSECSGDRIVQHADTAARSLVDLKPKQAGMLVLPSGAQRPYLTALKRFIADPILTLQLGGGNKFFNTSYPIFYYSAFPTSTPIVIGIGP